MAHDLLEHLGRVGRLDHQRCGGVPQIVDPEPVTEISTAAGGDEDRAPPVGQPQDAPAGSGEHELVSVLASDGRRQLDSQEPRQRDSAGLVRFRGAEDDTAADVGEGAADVNAAAIEVDVAYAQGGSFAPAEAGVGQQQDEQATAPGFGGEREDLAVSEEDVIAALRPGQAQAASRVGADTSASPRIVRAGPSSLNGASQPATRDAPTARR